MPKKQTNINQFFKVTDEVLENYTLDEIVIRLDEKTKEMITAAMAEKESRLTQALLGCESPIEMMLAISFEEADIFGTADYLGVDILGTGNQIEIESGIDHHYRVDFLIETCHQELKIIQNFVIECDGHDFREKTKEQVAKNNRRTRNLVKDGYVVINFSGSEIYENPFRCVREIKSIITSWYSKRIQEQRERERIWQVGMQKAE